jgi:Nif-specific regulatory protein
VDAVNPVRLLDIPVVEVPMTPPVVAPASVAYVADGDALDDVSPASVESLVVDSDGKPEGERERLIWAMERCGWVQAKAARLLKISPRQMGYALQKNEIEVRKF